MRFAQFLKAASRDTLGVYGTVKLVKGRGPLWVEVSQDRVATMVGAEKFWIEARESAIMEMTDAGTGLRFTPEAADSYADMIEYGLVRLPSEHMLLGHDLRDEDGDSDGTAASLITYWTEVGGLISGVSYFRVMSWPNKNWALIPATVTVEGADVNMRVEGGIELNDPKRNLIRLVSEGAAFMLRSLLLMLATQGVVRKTMQMRPGRPASKYRGDTYTMVYLDKGGPGGDAEGAGGERHRPRLHFRRGHKRDQRYGPKLRWTRPIWIKPRMIGHAEDGEVHHAAYVVIDEEDNDGED